MNPFSLNKELSSFMDPDSPFFDGFPENEYDIADGWSGAIESYIEAIIPPSTTSKLAINTFKVLIVGITIDSMFTPVLTSALLSFAAILAVGMAPTFIGVPPIIPIILPPVTTLGFNSTIHAPVIALLTTTIDLWFRTGMATNPISGVTIPWS